MMAPGTAGRRRGLALGLGPGGTRGFAHLGVLDMLLGAGLRVDAVAGASAGALFGALFAMDASRAGIAQGTRVTRRELWGLFRDRLRLEPSNPLGARLAQHFGTTRLEALPLPLTILAVDLLSGEEVLLREGSLREAVQASIAIPLLAEPVAINGRYLIDGGYGRRGASVVARAMGDVAVYVDLGEIGLCPPRLRRHALRLARRLHRPGRQGPPDRRDVLRRAILAMAAGPYEPHDADLVIAPRLADINPNSPFAAAEAYRRGERAARAALPALQRLLTASADRSAPDVIDLARAG